MRWKQICRICYARYAVVGFHTPLGPTAAVAVANGGGECDDDRDDDDDATIDHLGYQESRHRQLAVDLHIPSSGHLTDKGNLRKGSGRSNP